MTALTWTPATPRLIIPDWDDFKRFGWKLLLDGQFAPGQDVQMIDRGTQAPPASSLEYVAAAAVTSTTTNISISANAAVGDLAVLSDITLLSTTPMVAPSGWVLLATSAVVASSRYQIRTSYRILQSGDPGTAVESLAGTSRRRAMQVYRYGSGISTVAASTWVSESTNGTPAQQTASASGQGTPLVVIGVAGHGTLGTATLTPSPAMDGTLIAGTDDILMGYKIYNSSPADHTFDSGDAGNANHLSSGYIRITG